MPDFASPLRYPGGKGGLAGLLARIVRLNGLEDGIYAEPYAGGAGAALSMLFSERVAKILINDLDHCIYSFWRSILWQSKQFLGLLNETPVSIEEWHRQREIYVNSKRYSQLRVGFATFFLNRCNRSGIIVNGGPIGGLKQEGRWKIDARYNKEELRRRIEKIATYRDRIEISNLDALAFLRHVVTPASRSAPTFCYLDPPYFGKGKMLYMNAYEDGDHRDVAQYLQHGKAFKWLLSYENIEEVRELYREFQQVPFGIAHTAYERREGKELLIFQEGLRLPDDIENLIYRRRIFSN